MLTLLAIFLRIFFSEELSSALSAKRSSSLSLTTSSLGYLSPKVLNGSVRDLPCLAPCLREAGCCFYYIWGLTDESEALTQPNGKTPRTACGSGKEVIEIEQRCLWLQLTFLKSGTSYFLLEDWGDTFRYGKFVFWVLPHQKDLVEAPTSGRFTWVEEKDNEATHILVKVKRQIWLIEPLKSYLTVLTNISNIKDLKLSGNYLLGMSSASEHSIYKQALRIYLEFIRKHIHILV